ncbi:MAG: twin-arginine translocase TatA/TatE family subunit [Peptococcaceae bacterium]|nr:twin-arginine translocase TatA/TatE family subunit [Peptococcaceae bacterium]
MVTVFGLAISGPVVALLIVLALIIFGPGKLPDVGKALGRGLKEFKKASDSPDQGKDANAELASSAPVQVQADEAKSES